MFLSPALPGRLRIFVLMLLAVLPAMVPAAPVLAQDNPSGLPLPRFVTTRSHPINVRVGPGTRYDIAWNFLVSGVPVEIVQEFDTWRKIRDIEGDEGWVHQSLLAGARAAYATPLVANGEVALHADDNEGSAVRARLSPGFKVSLSECTGTWCRVTASQPGGASYSGWVRQEELWGVYPDETFD